MSIDLDWSKLDASFASSLIDVLNRQLQSPPRPSFIGPIEITSFDFGSQPPDIELVDLRDIYPDFLEDDDDDDEDEEDEQGERGNPDAVERDVPAPFSTAGQDKGRGDRRRDDEEEGEEEGEEAFEWVSRKSAGRGLAHEPPPLHYHHLPPHVRYARGPASDVFHLARPPSLGPSPMSSSPLSLSLGSAPPAPGTGAGTGQGTGSERRTTTSSSLPSASAVPSWRSSLPGSQRSHSERLGPTRPTPGPPSSSSSSPPPSPPSFSPRPDLADDAANRPPPPPPPPLASAPPPRATTAAAAAAAAARTATSSTDTTQDEDEAVAAAADDARPKLQLHLLVSWHSDLRLTLTTSLRINYPSPLFMSLPIKLSVTGLVFNGELAVAYEGGRRVHLCVLDDLDPYGPSARRFSGGGGGGSQGSTPSDPEGDGGYASKPLPVGLRLLPEIFIESELGQADKHVLKNVTLVEKFIQDVIRKTVEEELVFPNFHTLVLA